MSRTAHKPAHPGAVLRLDALPAVGLPLTQVAAELGVSRRRMLC